LRSIPVTYLLEPDPMPYYIQRRDDTNTVETIDEITDSKEAYRVAREYGLADTTARYYIAKKPCKAWLES
jgi:hypothetical protein